MRQDSKTQVCTYYHFYDLLTVPLSKRLYVIVLILHISFQSTMFKSVLQRGQSFIYIATEENVLHTWPDVRFSLSLSNILSTNSTTQEVESGGMRM